MKAKDACLGLTLLTAVEGIACTPILTNPIAPQESGVPQTTSNECSALISQDDTVAKISAVMTEAIDGIAADKKAITEIFTHMCHSIRGVDNPVCPDAVNELVTETFARCENNANSCLASVVPKEAKKISVLIDHHQTIAECMMLVRECMGRMRTTYENSSLNNPQNSSSESGEPPSP